MIHNTEARNSKASSGEVAHRFNRLRQLIHDDRRRQRLLFIASLIALAIVSVLAGLARLVSVLSVDVWFTQELQERPLGIVTELMVVVSAFGYMPWSATTIAVGALLVALFLGWKDAVYLVALAAIQGLINAGIKIAIGRPRPVDTLVDVFVPVHGNSFPSGHVMFYTVFFGFLLFLVWSRLPSSLLRWVAAIFCIGLIVLIGPSRIILGAHWLSDVIAAYLLSLIILAFGIEIYLRYLAPTTPEQQEGLMQTLDQNATSGVQVSAQKR